MTRLKFLLHSLTLIPVWILVLTGSVGCDVIINEINSDNPGYDTTEFVELYNTDRNNVSLDGYVLVFWQGSMTPPRAYNVFYLSEFRIGGCGFFLIGQEAVVPTPNIVRTASQSKAFLQNGRSKCAAVALYKGNPANYAKGMHLTKMGLKDAVAYYNKEVVDCSMFFPALLPKNTPLGDYSRVHTGDHSISRCTGNDPFDLGQFEVRRISPGSSNLCNDSEPASTNVQTPSTTSKTARTSLTEGQDRTKVIIIIGVSSVTGVVLLALLVAFIIIKKRRGIRLFNSKNKFDNPLYDRKFTAENATADHKDDP